MIVGEKPQNAVQALESLKSRSEIKEVPAFKQYLGMNIKATSTGIHLSQEDQIDDLVNSFRLHNAHPTKSPLDPGTIIDDAPDPKINIKEYQRGTGVLQYLATKLGQISAELPPSLLSACQPEDFPNLDTIALAGEPVPQGLADAWVSRHLLNLYGPAEVRTSVSFPEENH
jgi:hypothetical protein